MSRLERVHYLLASVAFGPQIPHAKRPFQHFHVIFGVVSVFVQVRVSQQGTEGRFDLIERELRFFGFVSHRDVIPFARFAGQGNANQLGPHRVCPQVRR